MMIDFNPDEPIQGQHEPLSNEEEIAMFLDLCDAEGGARKFEKMLFLAEAGYNMMGPSSRKRCTDLLCLAFSLPWMNERIEKEIEKGNQLGLCELSLGFRVHSLVLAAYYLGVRDAQRHQEETREFCCVTDDP